MGCDIFEDEKDGFNWHGLPGSRDTTDAVKHNYMYPSDCQCRSCLESRFDRPTEGTKHDDGKARYDLFPWDLMDGVVAVYTHGAKEYADNNWRKGFAWGRIIGAVFRHFVAWITGNDLDPKTGLHNLDQAVWNLLCLRYMQKAGKGIDDRWK